MNRLHRSVSIGALVAAVGAAVALGFQQETPARPGTQPSPGTQPRDPAQPANPSRPTRPYDPTRPSDPSQPGTQPRDPYPSQPGTNPNVPGRQPGQPDLTRPNRDLNQPGTRDTTRTTTTTTNTQITLGQPVSRQVVDQVIVSWPAETKRIVTTSFEKFGEPVAVTSDSIVWHDVGDWKKVVIMNEPVDHNFPMPHKDFLLTWVPMKVPQNKIADLIAFDGSIMVNRTAGLVGVMCHREEANIAVLNLAHEIIQGTKDVQQARAELARVAMGLEQGTQDPITQELRFDVQRTEQTADPDQPFRGGMTPGMDRPGTMPPGLDRPGTTPPGLDRPGTTPPGLDRPGQPRTPGTDPNNPNPTTPRRPGGG
jgi:hypothetical protein